METTHITVFTPTYNRALHLLRLYEHIKQQAYPTFEWLIVDDGSDDGTRELVDSFRAEGKVDIRYFLQENSGKHIAINKAVEQAKGKLFFIVDSDDFLTANALQIINDTWQKLYKEHDGEGFAGICGLRCFQDGTVIGGAVDYEVLDASVLEYRYKRKYKGDKAEVFLTEVLACYRFPVIEGETFCTEGLVWNRIGRSYKMRFINKPLYITEYLPGGLSANSFYLRRTNPRYACLYYSELLNTPGIPFGRRVRTAINYWRFAMYNRKDSFGEKYRLINQPWSIVVLPVCYFLYCITKIRDKSVR